MLPCKARKTCNHIFIWRNRYRPFTDKRSMLQTPSTLVHPCVSKRVYIWTGICIERDRRRTLRSRFAFVNDIFCSTQRENSMWPLLSKPVLCIHTGAVQLYRVAGPFYLRHHQNLNGLVCQDLHSTTTSSYSVIVHLRSVVYQNAENDFLGVGGLATRYDICSFCSSTHSECLNEKNIIDLKLYTKLLLIVLTKELAVAIGLWW